MVARRSFLLGLGAELVGLALAPATVPLRNGEIDPSRVAFTDYTLAETYLTDGSFVSWGGVMKASAHDHRPYIVLGDWRFLLTPPCDYAAYPALQRAREANIHAAKGGLIRAEKA